MKILVRILTFLAMAGLLGVVVWCAVAPSPDLTNIPWMPGWLGHWADVNPTFRNFPAVGMLAAFFYLAGFTWFDPRRGAGQCALAFIASVASSLVAVGLEVYQVRLPGRFFDPNDIAWSMAGALAGAAAAFLAGLPFSSRKN
jgi:hypothetical protein